MGQRDPFREWVWVKLNSRVFYGKLVPMNPFSLFKRSVLCINIVGHAVSPRFLRTDSCLSPDKNLTTPWTLRAQLGLSTVSILGHLFEFHKSHNSCFLWIAFPTWSLANSLYWGGCDCRISIANGRICSTCWSIIFRSYQYFLERKKKITASPPLSFLEMENFLMSNTCQTQRKQCLYVCTHMSSVFRLWRSCLQL